MRIPKNNAESLAGRRVLLVGLGLHGGGEATVRWLCRAGAKVQVTDTKTAAELKTTLAALKKLPVTWHLGGYAGVDWRWPERIIVNPAANLQTPMNQPILAAAARGVRLDNEASLFVRQFPGTLIGVTGTRGKTTTTLLLSAIVKKAHRPTIVSGNVRQVAMLDYLPRATPATWAVFELSSYQLEQLPVPDHPFRVAVMTNLKVDHLNRHGTMRNYADVKYNLFRGQQKSDVAVVNADDPFCRRAVKETAAQVIWYGHQVPVTGTAVSLRNGWVVERTKTTWRRLFPRSAWHLAGDHNIYNLLAATAAARALDISPAIIAAAVKAFTGVPHRQQIVRTWRGHAFVNDTAATSPDGTLAALSVYPRGVYIVGGTDKALDLKPLARALEKRHARFVTLPGTATDKLLAALPKAFRPHILTADSMASAVHAAVEISKPGEPIVLSPGAASFGLFLHEFDRGDQFIRVVNALR